MSRREELFGTDRVSWVNSLSLRTAEWVCAYCGNRVASYEGNQAEADGEGVGWVRYCPSCRAPTFCDIHGQQRPAPPPGHPVESVPDGVRELYEEARLSAGAGAYTAAVLVLRKLLMHVAVECGAAPNKPFASYVEYLSDSGYIAKGSKGWVDYIRQRSNEATHEIQVMKEEDATNLVTFAGMLLRTVYEFPALVPTVPPST